MSENETVNWIFPLGGHEFDLEDLPYWLEGYDVQIVKRDDGYYLQIAKNHVGEDLNKIRDFAETQLELINGVGRLLGQHFRPVVLTGNSFGIDESGDIVHTVVAVKGAEIREKVGTLRAIVGGEQHSDPREAAALPFLNAAKLSNQACDALIICGRPILTWTDLYLLFELVEASVGSQMFTRGWISKNQASSFTNTANSYNALRHTGRHGKDKGNPPTDPMSLNKASGLIQELVRQWLGHEGGTKDGKTDS